MENMEVLELQIFFIQAWKVMEFFKCGSWEAMENKVIWAILYLQTKETGKGCTQSRNFSKKNDQIQVWKNVEGNTVRDYFKDTATPHFFNVAIRCIVLIKTAFSQARHPSSSFLRDKMA